MGIEVAAGWGEAFSEAGSYPNLVVPAKAKSPLQRPLGVHVSRPRKPVKTFTIQGLRDPLDGLAPAWYSGYLRVSRDRDVFHKAWDRAGWIWLLRTHL